MGRYLGSKGGEWKGCVFRNARGAVRSHLKFDVVPDKRSEAELVRDDTCV
ncbi:hypothetical protein ACVIIV_001094 [Bradyrhizobium sp. USDA 4354]